MGGTTADDARQSADTAASLLDDLIEGAVRERDEAATVARIRGLLEGALAGFEAAGLPVEVAAQVHRLGLLARETDDLPAAIRRFEDAAARCEAAGAPRAAWRSCVQLAELDPAHPAALATLRGAVDAGLPEDLDPEEDPRRAAAALGRARDTDAALALYAALVADADGAGRGGRAASLLRDVARIEEDQLKDRRRALATLERGLALAEAAKDKVETGAALLRLMDLHNSRGDRKRAKAFYERVAKMRGLPGWQKTQIRVLRTVFG